jgi:hypothetical protein
MKVIHVLPAANQWRPSENGVEVFNIKEHFITQKRGFLFKKPTDLFQVNVVTLLSTSSSTRSSIVFRCSYLPLLYHYLPDPSHSYTMQLVFTAREAAVTLSFNLNFLVPLALKVPYVTQQLLPTPPPSSLIYSLVKEYDGRYILTGPHDTDLRLSELFYTRNSELQKPALEQATTFIS